MVRIERAVVVVGLLAGVVGAVDQIGVEGSDITFPSEVTRQVGPQQDVKLVLTGTGLREKAWFNVYALGSYIQEGAGVKTAEALAKADLPKMLDLQMEREVDGEDMASAFRDAIRANYPSGFDEELGKVDAYFLPKTVTPGVHIRFVNIPQVGLRCEVTKQKPLLIKNPAFSKAMWDVYLGPNNIGDEVKQNLVSRL